MKYLASFFITFSVVILFSAPALAQNYDIKNDFCGAVIEASLCQCAFHDDNCQSTGLDQQGAEEYLYSEFDLWTTQQEKERCAALDKDYEGECVDRDEERQRELAATFGGDLLCAISNPSFWKDFFDEDRSEEDSDAQSRAFAIAHGYASFEQGEQFYGKFIQDSKFRLAIETRAESVCPGIIDFDAAWERDEIEVDDDSSEEDETETDEDEDSDESEDEEDFFGGIAECSEVDHEQFDRKKRKCTCSKLYKKDKENDCVFIGDKGTRLEVESSIELTSLMDALAVNERVIFRGQSIDGESIEVGIVRLPDGEYVFTSDGEHYYDNPKDAIKPGLIRRARTFISDLWGQVGMAFGVGRYTSKGTATDPEKQIQGQARYDASSEAYKALSSNPKPPKTRTGTNKLWAERIAKLVTNKKQEIIEKELSTATGLDAKAIGQFIRGEYRALSDEKLSKITAFLQTLPAQSVVVLAKELRTADFANGASLYIDKREEGSSPQEVTEQLYEGELVELEFISSKGIAYEHTRLALLEAYEDAYQRYLLKKELQR